MQCGTRAIYCKRVLNPVRIILPEALRDVEAVCIDVTQRYRIVSIYRPPNCSNMSFLAISISQEFNGLKLLALIRIHIHPLPLA